MLLQRNMNFCCACWWCSVFLAYLCCKIMIRNCIIYVQHVGGATKKPKHEMLSWSYTRDIIYSTRKQFAPPIPATHSCFFLFLPLHYNNTIINGKWLKECAERNGRNWSGWNKAQRCAWSLKRERERITFISEYDESLLFLSLWNNFHKMLQLLLLCLFLYIAFFVHAVQYMIQCRNGSFCADCKLRW